MAKERSQKVVETYKAVAAGLASVVTALFTSKLGIAGTLIGTALTAISITLISAILKIQLEKATDTIAGLPGAVQGRLSTQQIRIPGSPGPEPDPEPAAQPESRRGRLRGFFARLRALPGFLKDLPSNQRRKMLVAGALAGLLATAIGLTGVTGIEIAGGKPLSCLVWSSCPENNSSEDEASDDTGGLSIFGGMTRTSTAPQEVPDGETPSGKQPATPGDGQQLPQQRQPGGQPAQPSPDAGGNTPGQPGAPPNEEAPEDGAPEQPNPKDAGQPEPGQKDDSKSRPEGSLGPRGAERAGEEA